MPTTAPTAAQTCRREACVRRTRPASWAVAALKGFWSRMEAVCQLDTVNAQMPRAAAGPQGASTRMPATTVPVRLGNSPALLSFAHLLPTVPGVTGLPGVPAVTPVDLKGNRVALGPPRQARGPWSVRRSSHRASLALRSPAHPCAYMKPTSMSWGTTGCMENASSAPAPRRERSAKTLIVQCPEAGHCGPPGPTVLSLAEGEARSALDPARCQPLRMGAYLARAQTPRPGTVGSSCACRS